MNIRLFKPTVGAEELKKIEEAFDKAWIGLGPNVKEFEDKWSDFMGGSTSIALNSCTAFIKYQVRLSAFNAFTPVDSVVITSGKNSSIS